MSAQVTAPVLPEIIYPATAMIESLRPVYSPEQKVEVKAKIKKLLKAQDAVLIAHYYVDRELQELAEETGGYVSDSLDMAKFGNEHSAKTLIIAGVRFMGETAKILNPEKRVLMPTLDAECSLDLSCKIEDFGPFCDEHPDHTVVVYANTSAAVKARADYVVTSGIALDLVSWLADQGKKILWAPDRHLGNYIQRATQVEMIRWQGACIVHDEFKSRALGAAIEQYPDAAVLVHPESPTDVIALADVVGSTTQIINAAKNLPNKQFIVATDKGIFYKMKKAAPDKEFIEAPTHGAGATCKSCAHCPWMAMNGLDNLLSVLEEGNNEIFVDEDVRINALRSTQRMLDFARDRDSGVLGD